MVAVLTSVSPASLSPGPPGPVDADHTLYERVAAHVASLIDGQTLRAGDRIPSVRKLSEQQGVSVSTVLQAYLLLESRGLIETRPQSGHYVRARLGKLAAEPKMSRPSATATRPSVTDLVAKVYGATRDPAMVPLGAAYPGTDVLPVAKLQRIVASIARRHGEQSISYDAPPGTLALRRQIARRSLEWGCGFSPDDLVTTCGAMEALAISLHVVAAAGDVIAVESPTYYGVLQLIESLGMKALEIPTHPRDGMSIDALEEALRTTPIKAVLATPNFNNPLGGLMSDANKKRLVELLAKQGVPLIEDDIYGDLHFSEKRPRPAKAWDKHGLVLLCSSFSKTIAPGYRVGWAAPGRFRERFERMKFAYSVATATLPQLAVAAFLDEGGYDRHLRRMRRMFFEQVQRVSETVTACFPAGTRVARPAGGFVVWVELPRDVSALELHRLALARGISVAPGPIFSAKGRYESCIRLNCGNPWTERIARAIEDLGAIATRLAR
ncbi:MAG: PLP-dependent aminotransferase family protein [Polyangiales bacterium]